MSSVIPAVATILATQAASRHRRGEYISTAERAPSRRRVIVTTILLSVFATAYITFLIWWGVAENAWGMIAFLHGAAFCCGTPMWLLLIDTWLYNRRQAQKNKK